MEFIFELIIELFAKDDPEVYMKKRMPKAIRYPLFVIVVMLYIAACGFLVYFGINHFLINPTGSGLLITIGFAFFVLLIINFIFMFKKYE